MDRDHQPNFFGDVEPRYHHERPRVGGAPGRRQPDHATDTTRQSATHGGESVANRSRKGALGEEAVGAELDTLARPWATVHDLTIGSRGANLDHLVLGPPRCFTINTKHLSGDVVVYERGLYVGGRATDHLPRAVEAAAKVAAALSVATGIDAYVWPVLVFHGCRVRVKAHPVDATILTTHEIRAWFRSQHERSLSPAQLMTLETAAPSPTTWPRPSSKQPSTPAPPPAPAQTAAPAPAGPCIRHWRRFGHDRTYVNLGAESLGYRDNTSGAIPDLLMW